MGRTLSWDKPEPESFRPELDSASAVDRVPAAALVPSKQQAAAFPAGVVVKLPTLTESGFTLSGWGIFPKFQASPLRVSLRAANSRLVTRGERGPWGFQLRSWTTLRASSP